MSPDLKLPDTLPREALRFHSAGRDRAVYAIEGYPAYLAKIATSDPDRLRKVFGHEQRFLRARRTARLPIARILGQCDTELGPAQITDAVRNDAGDVAPNLLSVLTSGSFSEEHLDALNDLVNEAIFNHIPFSDFSLRNLVYGYRAGDERPRVYVVDGFGDKSYIQIKRWFRWANTPHILRKFDRVPRGYGLRWDRRSRRYHFAPGGQTPPP